jgi:signal transduction histidine kinase
VRVEVEDTGAGIAPANTEKVFNPFFTTKKRGTGLGLAVTNKIIEDHAGRITVRSTPGVGTTFTVILPVFVPETRASWPRIASAAPAVRA